ncbi:MAG TPA: SCO family protein [Woeseiaceae bacterium]|nr:SCO family protein [Woeseiaceae bacterium]
MNGSAGLRAVILLAVVVGVIATSAVFAVLHYNDGDDRVAFVLTDQTGKKTTHNDLAGQHLLVFFGFTSCAAICPAQMSKLSLVTQSLYDIGYQDDVRPVFISVDPERDNVERVASYLENFHEDFIGLTGSRTALKSTATRFKTVLQDVPASTAAGYQLKHASLIYVVDPSSRVIDFIPFEITGEEIVAHVQDILQQERFRKVIQ